MINTNDSGVLQHNHLRQQEREGARRHVIQQRLVFFWDKPRGETQNKKQKQKTKKTTSAIVLEQRLLLSPQNDISSVLPFTKAS